MDRQKIGERLASIRKEKGQTKTFVAKSLGCSYNSVCCWEYGTRLPSDAMKIKLAEHFGVSVESLFYT